jgi:hypothetical protein
MKWDFLIFLRKFFVLLNTSNNMEICLSREIRLRFQLISGRLSWKIVSSISLDQQIKFVPEESAFFPEPLSPLFWPLWKILSEKVIHEFIKKFVSSQFPSSEPVDSHHIEEDVSFSGRKQGFWKLSRGIDRFLASGCPRWSNFREAKSWMKWLNSPWKC